MLETAKSCQLFIKYRKIENTQPNTQPNTPSWTHMSNSVGRQDSGMAIVALTFSHHSTVAPSTASSSYQYGHI